MSALNTAWRFTRTLASLTRRKPFSMATLILVMVIGLATLYGVTRPARHDRDWVEHLSRLPHVEISETGFSVSPVRDWRYAPSGPVDQRWIEAPQAFDFSDLRRVWLMVEPHPSMEETMAHTLVFFEFSQDRLIGVTIEARREAHEKYGPFMGNWGKFELLYMWASPRDLLTRRAVLLDHQVQVFPLAINADDRLAFLLALLDETRAIEARPRLYNTLFSNCTNELAKAADLDWDPAFITTGKAAPRLHELGLIPPSDSPWPVVRDRGDVTGDLKTLNLIAPTRFDAEFLKLLRARWADADRLG